MLLVPSMWSLLFDGHIAVCQQIVSRQWVNSNIKAVSHNCFGVVLQTSENGQHTKQFIPNSCFDNSQSLKCLCSHSQSLPNHVTYSQEVDLSIQSFCEHNLHKGDHTVRLVTWVSALVYVFTHICIAGVQLQTNRR